MNEYLSSDAPVCATDDPDNRADIALTSQARPLFLVGMMGAGKTTIGRHLARLLNREFVDLDHELEARCGVRVSVIFEIEGEDGFRKRETLSLDACTQRKDIVLATGGGAVLAAENRRYLKERGLVVYLRATPEELCRRIARDHTRPLLQTADPQEKLRSLLVQREPLYDEVAHITFDTGSVPVTQAARALAVLVKNHEVGQ
jgi:shikimate kinase